MLSCKHLSILEDICVVFFLLIILPSSLLQMGTGVWTPDGVMERSVMWVTQVWQQLNACLSRLGTHEALLGPQLFLSCPVVPNNTQAVVR